jgi:hypothetical protein
MAHESIATGLALGVARNRRMLVALQTSQCGRRRGSRRRILDDGPGIEHVDPNQPAVVFQSVIVSVFQSSSANCSFWNLRRRAMQALMH